MADWTVEQVRALLESEGLPFTEEDLPEVAHRVNAVREALGALEHPGLDAVEPLPVFWLTEEAQDGR